MEPFVKWAGGKRQLLSEIMKRMPGSYGRYYEPFIGGGAVLFALRPKDARINDVNRSLVHTYRIVRDCPEGFLEAVRRLDEGLMGNMDGKAYYIGMRTRYNGRLAKGTYDTETAALFVFLNKHCFNGLYRVNRGGLFNVPYNGSVRPSVDARNILDVSGYLQGVGISEGDFGDAVADAGPGDFIFFDSPYAPLKPGSFGAYTKEGFGREDHGRLSDLFDRLSERGCRCMLTNHDTELIRDLYGGKGYHMDTVGVRRMINSDASGRTGTEVIIWNY